MRKLSAIVIAAIVMAMSAAPAFADDPSPGESGHEGQGQFTAKFVPASTPGKS